MLTDKFGLIIHSADILWCEENWPLWAFSQAIFSVHFLGLKLVFVRNNPGNKGAVQTSHYEKLNVQDRSRLYGA